MKTVRGLYTDCNPIDTPAGYSPFIKNAVLTDKLGSIINERGFNIFANVPFTIIGVEVVQDNIYVFTTNNTLSEIGKVNLAGTYSKIINDNDLVPSGSVLNFNINFPIDTEAYKDARGHVIIAFIDDQNTPKIINCDEPSLQRSDYELFPIGRTPVPEVSVSDTGGSLPSGSYRILYNYEDEDGSQSDYSVTSKPVSIVAGLSGATSLPFGSAPNTATSKSILVTIQPLDAHWKFINIIVIKTINNITSVAKVKQIPIKYQFVPTGGFILGTPIGIDEYSIVNVSYTGAEPEVPMLLETVLSKNATYLTAKAIGQLNNKLYLGNLTADQEILLQKYCTGIQANWTSKLPGGGSSSLVDNTATYVNSWDNASFCHGEVYALYIQFRNKKTGVWTKGFHIPGREKLAGDDNVIAPGTGATYKSGSGSPTFKLFQLEDTCSFTSADPITNTALGGMGFWENDNETYPDNSEFDGTDISVPGGKNLRNQKVRHHKFPSIRYMKQSVYRSSNGFTSNTYGKYLDVLGLNINLGNAFNEGYSGPGAVPPEILEQLDGWRILYAKRDLANATVLGTSQIYFYGRGQSSNEIKPLVGNAQAASEAANDDIMLDYSNTTNIRGSEFMRFHAFNLMVDKPSIAPTYLRNELQSRHETGVTPASSNDPRLITDTADNNAALRKWLLYSPDTYASTFMTESGMTGNAPRAVATAYRFRHVEFLQYVPPGAVIAANGSTINNGGGEEHLLLKQNKSGLSLVDQVMALPTNVADSNLLWKNSMFHQVHLSSLVTIRTNVYTSFLNQTLVAADEEAKRQKAILGIGTDYEFPVTANISGGDCYVGPHSVQCTGPESDTQVVTTVGGEIMGEGYKSVNYFWTVSAKNQNYRYTSSDTQSEFYPLSALSPKIVDADWSTRFLGLQNITLPLQYLYDNSHNTRNDLVTQGVFDPEIESETEFPNTVIASLVQSTDTERISWRSFLAANRYVMPRDKGAIINLQGVGNQRLYIHQEYGLFLTKDRTTLKGDVVSITIGSGDIFDVTPYEVVSTDDGYAGTRHKFGCVLTKLGYVFTDAKQGKIFIHDGEKLDEVSNRGLRQFLLENINGDLPDNPFAGNGITVGFDEVYNRLIVTINDTANSKFITLSYSPTLESWVSFHDYAPSYMFSVRGKRLFSVKNNLQIFEHNVGPYGKYYQDVGRFPLIIDIPYNQQPYETKYFSSVGWTSQAYNDNVFLPNETFTELTLRSNSKTTGKVVLSFFENMADVYSYNTRNTESTWNFNQLRNIAIQIPTTGLTKDFYNNYELEAAAVDYTKDWYEQGRMVDDYLICRFEYNNFNNYKLILLDHNINTRKSYR